MKFGIHTWTKLETIGESTAPAEDPVGYFLFINSVIAVRVQRSPHAKPAGELTDPPCYTHELTQPDGYYYQPTHLHSDCLVHPDRNTHPDQLANSNYDADHHAHTRPSNSVRFETAQTRGGTSHLPQLSV